MAIRGSRYVGWSDTETMRPQVAAIAALFSCLINKGNGWTIGFKSRAVTTHVRYKPAAWSACRCPVLEALHTASTDNSLPSHPVASEPQPWILVDGDVVEYRLTPRERRECVGDDRTLGLGVITWEGKIHPLCIRRAGSRELFYDEEQDPLPESPEELVVRVLETGVTFSQRVVEDRIRNPHGEEAEDVFVIDCEVSEGCGPVRRYH